MHDILNIKTKIPRRVLIVSLALLISFAPLYILQIGHAASLSQVMVRFVSKLITATRDAAGAVIDGSPEAVVDVTDVWTFARTLGTRNPNWLLVATEEGQ